MPKVAVSEKDKQFVLQTIRRFFPDAKILFFGSRWRQNHQPASDLDICLNDGKPLDLLSLGNLKELLSQSSLVYKIDLSDWHRITPEFRAVILEGFEEW